MPRRNNVCEAVGPGAAPQVTTPTMSDFPLHFSFININWLITMLTLGLLPSPHTCVSWPLNLCPRKAFNDQKNVFKICFGSCPTL